MPEPAPLAPYYSYMLRFWPEPQASGETQWRFTLVSSNTGQKRSFASFDALVEYLTQFMQEDPIANPDSGIQA